MDTVRIPPLFHQAYVVQALFNLLTKQLCYVNFTKTSVSVQSVVKSGPFVPQGSETVDSYHTKRCLVTFWLDVSEIASMVLLQGLPLVPDTETTPKDYPEW